MRDLDLQAPGNRDWREKPQQEYPTFARRMTAKEGVDQRVGEADDLTKETGACELPEGCLWEVFAPEGLPAGDRAFVGTEACGKLANPAW